MPSNNEAADSVRAVISQNKRTGDHRNANRRHHTPKAILAIDTTKRHDAEECYCQDAKQIAHANSYKSNGHSRTTRYFTFP